MIWLFYDLGFKGDYEGLYQWLDDHDAKECGNGASCFLWSNTGYGDISEQIRNSLLDTFEPDMRKDRIYIVYKNNRGSYTGKFIFGTRKANPWVGFGTNNQEEVDEE